MAAIAAGVGICGVNRATESVTGNNYVAKIAFGGNTDVYDKFERAIGIASISTLSIAAMYGTPSTGRTQPKNLNEQVALNLTKANPSAGTVIAKSLGDPRMPGWMGWQKYSNIFRNHSGNIDIHYVGNKYIPIFFDFKIK